MQGIRNAMNERNINEGQREDRKQWSLGVEQRRTTFRNRHTCIYTHTHTYIHTLHYIHTYVHTHVHTYIHTYTHTYIHTYIHTYMILEQTKLGDCTS